MQTSKKKDGAEREGMKDGVPYIYIMSRYIIHNLADEHI